MEPVSGKLLIGENTSRAYSRGVCTMGRYACYVLIRSISRWVLVTATGAWLVMGFEDGVKIGLELDFSDAEFLSIILL